MCRSVYDIKNSVYIYIYIYICSAIVVLNDKLCNMHGKYTKILIYYFKSYVYWTVHHLTS